MLVERSLPQRPESGGRNPRMYESAAPTGGAHPTREGTAKSAAAQGKCCLSLRTSVAVDDVPPIGERRNILLGDLDYEGPVTQVPTRRALPRRRCGAGSVCPCRPDVSWERPPACRGAADGDPFWRGYFRHATATGCSPQRLPVRAGTGLSGTTSSLAMTSVCNKSSTANPHRPNIRDLANHDAVGVFGRRHLGCVRNLWRRDRPDLAPLSSLRRLLDAPAHEAYLHVCRPRK